MFGNRYIGDTIAEEFFKLTQLKKTALDASKTASVEGPENQVDDDIPDPAQFLQEMDKEPQIHDNMDKKIDELSSWSKEARDVMDIAGPLDESEVSEDISEIPEYMPRPGRKPGKEIKSMKDLIDIDPYSEFTHGESVGEFPSDESEYEDMLKMDIGDRRPHEDEDDEDITYLADDNSAIDDPFYNSESERNKRNMKKEDELIHPAHDYLLDHRATEILKGLGKIAGSLKGRGELFAADVVEATALSIRQDLIKESSEKLETINILTKIASEINKKGDKFTSDIVKVTIAKIKNGK